ncbi:uncharacterized protein LOC62_03G004202 [Vanrija pseudolonga]|uniref:Endonuclease/exonuclease/phosphatase domain-containing protein n=1 Tax=Vanrija pseudolonga TaxID=143232 RepID=A0AAF0YAR7_9TREE|nr:hypothetical protein LOC62_03G004202 [Vanrija pseudolonga]
MVTIPTRDAYPTLRLSTSPMTASSPPIHVATLNVRYDGQRNSPIAIPPTGAVPPAPRKPWEDKYREQAWAVRRSRLVDALLSLGSLDLIGFQEVYASQLDDLAALLGPRWAHVGVGRDDGNKAGEYSPIFFNSDRFTLVKWKSVWLSPTPDVPGSVGWDASQTRIATLLSLADVHGGTVHAVCTHYDDRGVKARAESSLLIRAAIRAFVDEVEGGGDPGPVLLFGDFNSPDSEDGYRNITSFDPLPSGKQGFTFLDAYTHLSARRPGHIAQSRPYGPKATYTGFAAPGRERTTRIDFVMLAAADGGDSARGGYSFSQYAVVDNWVEEGDVDGFEGRWSDHRAVRVTITKA